MVHILIALGLGLFFVYFVGQVTVVNGNSMEKTLHNKDRLIIEKVSLKFGNINRGDIVTIDVREYDKIDHSPIIKRVIGIEGDLVEIKDGNVYVNKELIKEDYISGDYTHDDIDDKYSTVKVSKNQVYVLGDNRNLGQSSDSRLIGPIDVKLIGGKAVFRFFPLDKFGVLK